MGGASARSKGRESSRLRDSSSLDLCESCRARGVQFRHRVVIAAILVWMMLLSELAKTVLDHVARIVDVGRKLKHFAPRSLRDDCSRELREACERAIEDCAAAVTFDCAKCFQSRGHGRKVVGDAIVAIDRHALLFTSL